MFDGAQIYSVDLSQKERTEANVLVRHLGEEVHANNKQSSVASRTTYKLNKMVTLQSLGPIENYNFRWGSNLQC